MSSRAGKARRSKHTRAPRFVAIGIVLSVLLLSAVTFNGALKLFDSWLEDLPDVTEIRDYAEGGITRVYAADRTTLLAELYLENREAVEYEEVSPYVFAATVATEDVRFYDHPGYDIQGIARAFVVNLLSGSTSEGASTITQQLVRNTILLDEMNEISIKRKVREIDLAVQAEHTYTKDEILLMYCNTVNYGDGAYGIQAASINYFSKNASDLTLSEAALLAGIPQSPTRLNPFNNYEAAIDRRNTVLDRMLTNGFITQEEHDQAVAEEIVLNKTERAENGAYLYPYFVDYVKSVLLSDYSTAEIFQGGLTVYTTLDMDIQRMCDETCYSVLEGQADDLEIAMLTMEPDTGHIVSMFGGRDYYTDQYNLATQAHRQCGSSFKGITLTAAVEQGMSPGTYFNGSSPLKITSDWTVSNDGGASYPNISLHTATNFSLNTVFAQVAVQLGPDTIVEMAHRLGITTDLESVPSITLGTQGVTVLEMTNAYATLAAGGVHRDPVCITEIQNSRGEVIYSEEDTGTQVITPEVAYAVTKVLQDDIEAGTAPGARLDGQVAAGKTGTTQNYRDGYFVGYTPQLCTAVWMGTRQERDNITYNGSYLYGGAVVAPIWKTFTQRALEKYDWAEWIYADSPDYWLENTSSIRPEGLTYEEQLAEEARKREEEEQRKREEEEAAQQAQQNQNGGSTTPTEEPGNGGGGEEPGDGGEGGEGGE